MNKQRSRLWLASAAGVFLINTAHAIDLAGVYNQALATDPTYKVAEATWLSAKENLPLAMVGSGSAGSGLFPNLTATGAWARNGVRRTGSPTQKYTDKQFSLTATQPIFNLATWSTIREAGFGVKSAYATYIAAGQNLIDRVAVAYFEVLRANETLQYTIKQKEADKWELITDLQKYKVGLTAVTGVYNSQASYDTQIATEINDRSTLRDNAENLRVITGKIYSDFKILPDKLPAVIPSPASMEAWVRITAKQSYAIKSAQMTMWQNKQAIKTSMMGVAPTLNAVGSYEYQDNSAGYAIATGGQTSTNTAQIGLALNFPMVQGGYVWVNTKQARANYLEASDNLQLTFATTTNSTRQSYLSITTGIAEIDADAQSILANEKNLEATRAAYLVGTRTMVDVLQAIAQLYNAKKAWASARYNYIEALFQLKYNAGTLSPRDIEIVNSWLQGSVKMQYDQPSYENDEYYNAGTIALMKYSGSSKSVTSQTNASNNQKISELASAAVAQPLSEPVVSQKASVSGSAARGPAVKPTPQAKLKSSAQQVMPTLPEPAEQTSGQAQLPMPN